MDAAPRPSTYADLFNLPNDVRAEIIDGQIVTLPSPRPRHSKAQRALGSFVGRPFAPDWVAEVLSESNEAHDRVTKRRIYAEHGVSHYWIIDPEARTIEALALDHGRWVDAG